MYKIKLLIVLLISLLSVSTQAVDKSLVDQIAEVKAMIEQETVLNTELKAKLATKETEISELKLKLKEIEDMIAGLKQKHNLG